jgi:PAS domain S-box-containing protein
MNNQEIITLLKSKINILEQLLNEYEKTAIIQSVRLTQSSEILKLKIEELNLKNEDIEKSRAAIINIMEDSKEAQVVLEKKENIFKDMVTNALEWIWEVDAAGLFTYSNQAVEDMLGFTPEEIVGKMHFYDLFHPDDKENMKKAAFDAFAKKESFQGFQNRNVHKNGNIIWLLTSGIPVLDDSRNLTGYRGADVDITEIAEKASKGKKKKKDDKHGE